MKKRLHLVGLGLINCLHFAAFIPAQSFTTIVFGGQGTAAIVILYVVFLLSNFIAPIFISEATVAYGLAFGSAGYLPFVAAFMTESLVLLFIGSVTVGIGAAALWTSIGVSATMLSNQDQRGCHISLFGSVSRFSFVGNMIVGASLQQGIPLTAVFWGLFLCNLTAAFGFLIYGLWVLRPLAAARDTAAEEPEECATSEVRETKAAKKNDGANPRHCFHNFAPIIVVLRYFVHRDFVPHLFSNLIVCGIIKAWVYSVYTRWSPGGNATAAFMMGIFGMVIPASGLFHGAIFDRMVGIRGKVKSLYLPIFLTLCGSLVTIIYYAQGSSSTALYFLAGMFFGLETGGAEAIVMSATSYLFYDSSNSAFGARFIVDCLGTILGFLIDPIAGDAFSNHMALVGGCLLLNALVVARYLFYTEKNIGMMNAKDKILDVESEEERFESQAELEITI